MYREDVKRLRTTVTASQYLNTYLENFSFLEQINYAKQILGSNNVHVRLFRADRILNDAFSIMQTKKLWDDPLPWDNPSLSAELVEVIRLLNIARFVEMKDAGVVLDNMYRLQGRLEWADSISFFSPVDNQVIFERFADEFAELSNISGLEQKPFWQPRSLPFLTQGKSNSLGRFLKVLLTSNLIAMD